MDYAISVRYSVSARRVPLVPCDMCGHRYHPSALYWYAVDERGFDSDGIPLDIRPICEDCLVEVAYLRDPEISTVLDGLQTEPKEVTQHG